MSKVYIGVDLGGTHMAAGVVTPQGHILASASTPTGADRPYTAIVRDMADCIRRALQKADRAEEDILSIGLGVPGIAEDGVVVFCTNLGWHNVPLEKELHQYFDKPVYIDNDATVAGWAEYRAGISKGTASSVFLTLGTGVGGGIVLNGRIWRGAHGVGSELGHITLAKDGVPCTCGKKGCMERYCSATAIIRMGREALSAAPESQLNAECGGDPGRMNAKMIMDAAKAGDRTALTVFDEYTDCLALAINNVITFLDPEMVILGGGVSYAGSFLLDAVDSKLNRYLLYPTRPRCRLALATLGNDAGIIGAALLGLNNED